MSQNRLGEETSPYLLQHANNPVHWHAWGPEALARAEAENKPVLLSVGYAACHWCHVMAHESFENDEIAALMNEHFVNIKVDREERPDIDAIYQHALLLTGQHGGWPLTMFLTPKGEPFWGGTYFPPTQRFGRPGFPEVLRAIAELYHGQPEKVAESTDALREALGKHFTPASAQGLPLAANDEAAKRLLGAFDQAEGGVGGAPKFPNPTILELVWRGFKRTGDPAMRDAVLLTLEKMFQGGIYDHLGGGFARYSTDARWLVPHFEKMLYDNAQLVDLLSAAWAETGNALFEARLRETVGWVLREMIADGGAFAATLDADSEGEEGKFYVWSEAEIDALLDPEDGALFKRVYDVHADGNWEGKTILHRNHPGGGLLPPEDEARLAECRRRLFEARGARVRPGWDDKVLADWNGLMIAAMANAAMVFDEPGSLDAAERAFQFVDEIMRADGRLGHSYRQGRLVHPATLDDYATMMRAAVALFEATGAEPYIARARALAAELDAHYWDAEGGGYFFTADDAPALILRTKSASDNATPAGNGVAAAALARLYYLTGEDHYRARAEGIIRAFAGEVARNFFPLASLFNANEILERTAQVVIVGPTEDAATQALVRAAWRASAPNRLVHRVAPQAALPASHPAAGKGMADGKPTAYVCVGQTCSLPLTDPDALIAAL